MSQNRTDKAKLCTAIVLLVLDLAHPNLSWVGAIEPTGK